MSNSTPVLELSAIVYTFPEPSALMAASSEAATFGVMGRKYHSWLLSLLAVLTQTLLPLAAVVAAVESTRASVASRWDAMV